MASLQRLASPNDSREEETSHSAHQYHWLHPPHEGENMWTIPSVAKGRKSAQKNVNSTSTSSKGTMMRFAGSMVDTPRDRHKQTITIPMKCVNTGQ